MLTTTQMCKEMGVCMKTLYTWRQQGCPHSFSLRRQTYMYDMEKVKKWLKERKRGNGHVINR